MPKLEVFLIQRKFGFADGYGILVVVGDVAHEFATTRIYASRAEAQKKADELTTEAAKKGRKDASTV